MGHSQPAMGLTVNKCRDNNTVRGFLLALKEDKAIIGPGPDSRDWGTLVNPQGTVRIEGNKECRRREYSH